jgi:hypothetical protein
VSQSLSVSAAAKWALVPNSCCGREFAASSGQTCCAAAPNVLAESGTPAEARLQAKERFAADQQATPAARVTPAAAADVERFAAAACRSLLAAAELRQAFRSERCR